MIENFNDNLNCHTNLIHSYNAKQNGTQSKTVYAFNKLTQSENNNFFAIYKITLEHHAVIYHSEQQHLQMTVPIFLVYSLTWNVPYSKVLNHIKLM